MKQWNLSEFAKLVTLGVTIAALGLGLQACGNKTGDGSAPEPGGGDGRASQRSHQVNRSYVRKDNGQAAAPGGRAVRSFVPGAPTVDFVQVWGWRGHE